MTFLLLSLVLYALGGLLAAALSLRSARAAANVGTVATVLASVAGLAAALPVLFGAPTQVLDLAWNVPFGRFDVRLDALSAWFLTPAFLVTALAAVYGRTYLGERHAGSAWLFFPLAAGALSLVLVARDGVLFLVAWEAMSLAAFFLVTLEDDRPAVRDAGWTYLVATHLGTAFLLAYFLVPQAPRDVLFVLALVGFGTKAGLVPMHVWLPQAHPAAPSHVSAWMSAVMIKTGVYGIMRAVADLGPAPAAWGWALLALGVASAVPALLMALAQRDLKRTLAYSSVENVGVIMIGLGLAVVTESRVALAGALLHVLHHGLFKALLFLAAGAVGSLDLERLGGLAKTMPRTAAAFLVGSLGASGVPPLNGFLGEFLILAAAFTALPTHPAAALTALGALALVAGLSLAVFTRTFGVAFLGTARADFRREDPGPGMLVPMGVLAALCLVLGVAAPLGGTAVLGVTGEVDLSLLAGPAAVGVFVVLTGGMLFAVRRMLPGPVEEGPTWGCGYHAPTPRMQYTASSFALPLLDLLAGTLRSRWTREPVTGLFPAPGRVTVTTPDPLEDRAFRPVFEAVRWSAGRLRWFQGGNLRLYVLYLLLTLVGLVVWGLQ